MLTFDSASIYIIFIIAALELRQDIVNGTLSAIKELATALRKPPSGEFDSKYF